MRNMCSKLCDAVFIAPFSAGNPTKTSRGEQKTDGSTSVTVLTAVSFPLITIMFFILIRHRGDNEELFNLHWACSTPFMLIALTSLIAFTISTSRNKQAWTKENAKNKQEPSVNVQLGFLWIFGIAMMVQCSLEIIVVASCISSTSGVLLGYLGHLLSSAAKIAYLIVQLLFISSNMRRHFVNTIWINFMLGGIVFTNACIWLEFVSRRIAYLYEFEQNAFLNRTLTCYHHSKPQEIIRTIDVYIVPITAAFVLLAISFTVKMCPAVGRGTSSRERDLVLTEDSQIGHNLVMKTAKKFGFVISILVHIPVFIFALLTRYVYVHTNVVLFYWQIIGVVQKLLMLGIIFVGFSYLEPRKSTAWKLSSDDYVLLTCMVAKLISVIVVNLSAFNCGYNQTSLIGLLYHGFVYLALIFYQTIYLLMSNRPMHNRNAKSRVSTFIQSVFVVVYIGRWFVVSFILSYQGEDIIITEDKVCIFKDSRVWSTTQYLITPCATFYDFISAMYYYGMIFTQ
ncbi:uncharacterized protein LOC130053134 isoform X1 [Ostrea edulis]|uniref:uncharacterized protein LOC130053134 isoform X1 n=1 Tax=Ostrea edulis TaxID=37623 RepID=UPI0024AF759C|nr:uncharacterized protein LOC130053134 isoform X1 [Ostrea edulis]